MSERKASDERYGCKATEANKRWNALVDKRTQELQDLGFTKKGRGSLAISTLRAGVSFEELRQDSTRTSKHFKVVRRKPATEQLLIERRVPAHYCLGCKTTGVVWDPCPLCGLEAPPSTVSAVVPEGTPATTGPCIAHDVPPSPKPVPAPPAPASKKLDIERPAKLEARLPDPPTVTESMSSDFGPATVAPEAPVVSAPMQVAAPAVKLEGPVQGPPTELKNIVVHSVPAEPHTERADQAQLDVDAMGLGLYAAPKPSRLLAPVLAMLDRPTSPPNSPVPSPQSISPSTESSVDEPDHSPAPLYGEEEVTPPPQINLDDLSFFERCSYRAACFLGKVVQVAADMGNAIMLPLRPPHPPAPIPPVSVPGIPTKDNPDPPKRTLRVLQGYIPDEDTVRELVASDQPRIYRAVRTILPSWAVRYLEEVPPILRCVDADLGEKRLVSCRGVAGTFQPLEIAAIQRYQTTGVSAFWPALFSVLAIVQAVCGPLTMRHKQIVPDSWHTSMFLSLSTMSLFSWTASKLWPRRRDVVSVTMFCPHMASAVLTEFATGVTEPPTHDLITARLGRLSTLNIADAAAAAIKDGTERVILQALKTQHFFELGAARWSAGQLWAKLRY